MTILMHDINYIVVAVGIIIKPIIKINHNTLKK